MSDKYKCKNCGSNLLYSPGDDALKCKNCGKLKSINTTRLNTKDLDINIDTISNIASELEENNEKIYNCSSCGSQIIPGEGKVSINCIYCGKPYVDKDAYNRSLIRPLALVPFFIKKEETKAIFDKWLKSGWTILFRPSNFSNSSKLKDFEGIYIPFWTFDMDSDSSWSADIGYDKTRNIRKKRIIQDGKGGHREEYYNYQEHYIERDNGRNGRINIYFNDLQVQANTSLKENITSKILPFDMSNLVDFLPDYLVGWSSEAYSIPKDTGLEKAQQQADRDIKSKTISILPGDTYRNLHINTKYFNLKYRHILLPIRVGYYNYSGKTYNIYINGSNGKIGGEAPWSYFKIIFTLIIIIVIVSYIIFGTDMVQISPKI